ncbi:spherulation-specific family 4 protein [Chitinivorax sp. PXF-14]|uniref:spherulation-specific family 4 protein n=1 Tax=Chitinivorax sp. PXF-14 TaxID=3230488 RepID=UPI00346507A6
MRHLRQLFAGLVSALALVSAQAAALEVLVPAYFYPAAGDSNWPRLTQAAKKVPVVAILNPNSGPGSRLDTAYLSAVQSLRTAGGKVIGYIPTGYGKRSLSSVTAQIEKYLAWYPVDGIFLDEMANQATSAKLNYYQAIYQYIKARNPALRVIGNPGINTAEIYASLPAADTLVVYESTGGAYPSYVQSAWNQAAAYTPSRFAELVYAATDLNAAMSRAAKQKTGMLYVTNRGANGSDPWSGLPAYWDAEVSRIATINATP